MNPTYSTDEELLQAVKTSVEIEGQPPTLELLAKRIHTSACNLRKFGTIKDVLLAANATPVNLPHTASQFECVVYDMLCEVFGEHDIQYQYTIGDCRTTKALPFDFYIKSINLIESADGTQHYGKGKAGWGERCKETDAIKNEYCRTHGIALLRVRHRRYWWKREDFKNTLAQIQLHAQETGHANCFNCWDGSGLIPISSQASIKHKPKTVVQVETEGSTTKYRVYKNGKLAVDALFDKEFYDKHLASSSVYVKKGKLYYTGTGMLVANMVLERQGSALYIVEYKNGNAFDLRKENLYIVNNKDKPRPKRGLYNNSTTGVRGLTISKGMVKGKYYYSVVAFNRDTGKKKSFSFIRYGSQEAALEAGKRWLEEGSTTIPEGSTSKRTEMGNTQTGKAVGEDIV